MMVPAGFCGSAAPQCGKAVPYRLTLSLMKEATPPARGIASRILKNDISVRRSLPHCAAAQPHPHNGR